MLTETFITATEAVNKPSAHLSSALKDVGIFHYEFQPQNTLRHGYKKSSVKSGCLAISDSHIFAAQANKAVIHVYSRAKNNQEATVPFPDKIYSLAYAETAAILIIGTEDGKLILWEVATGRIVASAAAHLEAVSSLVVTENNDHIISGSADSSIHVWSLGQLVSFSLDSQPYNDDHPINAPTRTFSLHRSGITALAVGHSKTNTNFVVSTASDRTCYLWNSATCQVLRTFLAPSISRFITVDPVDRAVYLGNEDGTIQSITLFEGLSGQNKKSIYDMSEAAPLQLMTQDGWSAPFQHVGAINCLTLSYDGTTLLSGHAGGMIVSWDVSKRRVISEVANLHQPVSFIQMIVPNGLQGRKRRYVTPVIVKPRLELNAETTDSTISVPSSYSFSAKVLQSVCLFNNNKAISDVLAGGLFPYSMLDDAIEAMNAKSLGLSSAIPLSVDSANKNDKYKIQALEEEKALLEKKLTVMQKLHDEAQERHRKRNERREAISQQKRKAYFAAKQQRKNGDEAIKPFDKQLEAIDGESDVEELNTNNEMHLDG